MLNDKIGNINSNLEKNEESELYKSVIMITNKIISALQYKLIVSESI